MSFSWPTPSNPSCTSMKPAVTSSFADALKRLAEHVEEKNKNIDINNSGTPNLVQLSMDFSNRVIPPHGNNSLSPEQALRFYTQYIHEAERREEMRRRYLRTYGGSNIPTNINIPTLNRRADVADPYRFMPPHLSSLLNSPAYLQFLAQQTRIPHPSQFLSSNIKTTDSKPRIPVQENMNQTSTNTSSLQVTKPKLKLFRPYDLDDSHGSSSHQTLSSSPSNVTKKSTPSPSICNDDPSTLPDESPSTASSGKEKQLFNSLGLVQQSTDITTETSSSIKFNEDSTSVENNILAQDNNLSNMKDSSESSGVKRKSVFSSNRKQSKINKIDHTVE